MKTHIWNLTKTFPGKVNFIDSNNVILGYDLQQCCCEHAFWTISETPDGKNPIYEGDVLADQEIELDGYVFDPKFCERESASDSWDEGGAAIFKLLGRRSLLSESPDLSLRLVNHHNGYYSHGFTFRGSVITEDSL